MITDTLTGLWPSLGVCLLSWIGYTIISRRYFHPLSHVPGPFLWSISTLPTFYYQGIKEGQLMHVLPSLHKKYGPVVRISPTEVHLSDPDAHEKIHSIGTKFTKDPSYYTPMNSAMKTPVILTVISNEEHRVRRAPLNPFFSRRSVLDVESIVWDKTKKLVDMMEAVFEKPGGVFDMHHAIRAFSVDVITEYAYARCWNQLDLEDFGMSYQDAIREIQGFFPMLITFSSVMVPVFGVVPDWVNAAVFPPFRKWFESLDVVRTAVTEVRKEISQGIKPPRRTIFHDLMELPLDDMDMDGKKQREPLSDLTVFADAVNVTGAGAETTGSTAARAIFEVLSNPVIYKRLSKELRDAFPDPSSMDIPALEKLPLLNGVIKETLRLSPGVPGRLPRLVPSSGATFNDIPLPPGSIVSMSAWVLHNNTDAFPNPEVFDPYRWIDEPDKIHLRDRCLIPFGRGSRNCLGQTLAMSELYSTVALIFHRFDGLAVGPDFGSEDLQLVELFMGYHPKTARKFKVVKK